MAVLHTGTFITSAEKEKSIKIFIAVILAAEVVVITIVMVACGSVIDYEPGTKSQLVSEFAAIYPNHGHCIVVTVLTFRVWLWAYANTNGARTEIILKNHLKACPTNKVIKKHME